jgi:RHS repeat-associated protein
VTTAAKENNYASAPPSVLLQTRVRGLAPENTTAIGSKSSVSSTLHWSSWQIYDGTASARLVGLDYFGARYFSAAQGRFTSPDEVFADQNPGNPQSWNLYAYGRNNPLRFTDPTGHASCDGAADCAEKMRDIPDVLRGDIYHADLRPQSEGSRGDRATGIVKGFAKDVLEMARTAGAPDANVDQVEHFLHLDPSTKNEKFGEEVATILGMFLPIGKKDQEAVNLAKSLASEGQVAELLSGGGRAIAGVGAKKAIEDLPRLTATYGGSAADWAKISSSAYKASDGTVMSVHAYKNVTTGVIVELKTALNH